jgi:hypothetical protein
MYWICIICGCLTGGKAEAGCGGGGSREMQILGGSEMQRPTVLLGLDYYS